MEDIIYLGTASQYPAPSRALNSLVIRLSNGDNWLFDCGEGTQTKCMSSHARPGKIKKIFISHLHGDHIFGLPGLMCSIGQAHRKEADNEVENDSQIPNLDVKDTESSISSTSKSKNLEVELILYGPVGLRKFINTSLTLSRSFLPYKYTIIEFEPRNEQENSSAKIIAGCFSQENLELQDENNAKEINSEETQIQIKNTLHLSSNLVNHSNSNIPMHPCEVPPAEFLNSGQVENIPIKYDPIIGGYKLFHTIKNIPSSHDFEDPDKTSNSNKQKSNTGTTQREINCYAVP